MRRPRHFATTAVRSTVTACLAFVIADQACAQPLDPEAYIKRYGHQSRRIGDDGKMVFYTATIRTTSAAVASRASEVAALPKDQRVFTTCDFMRGTTKANLVQSTGKVLDVVLSNYGYTPQATLACVLKYIDGPQVGTQVIFLKEAAGNMYMVFVVD